MVSIIFPNRPDPITERQLWYLIWYQKLTGLYTPTPKGPSIKDSDAPKFMNLLNDSNLRKTLLLRKNIAWLRRQLAIANEECLAAGTDFATVWKNLGKDGREAALEEGLVKVTPSTRCIEDWWLYCPDMLKVPMCRGDGEGFVDMVQRLKAPDANKLPSNDFPVLVHERVWAVHGIPLPGEEPEFPKPASIRAYHDLVVVQRHYFLSLVCLYTIAEARGVDAGIQFNEYDDYATRDVGEQAVNEMSMQFGSLRSIYHPTVGTDPVSEAETHMTPEFKANFQKVLKNHLSEPEKILCHVCKKGKQHGVKLLHCGAECQVLDYKKGDPPHKTICWYFSLPYFPPAHGAYTPGGKTLRSSGPTFSASTIDTPAVGSGSNTSGVSSCACQSDWYSPRMQLAMKIASEVGSDVILDSGEYDFPRAGDDEPFNPKYVYMGQDIPLECWPLTRKSDFIKFLRGYSFALTVLGDVIKTGVIPTLRTFTARMNAIESSPIPIQREHRGRLEDWRYFKKRGATLFQVLYAVIIRTSDEIGDGEMQDTFADEFDPLPVCDDHDDDFTTVSMMLCTT
ncbi:hypothetical protein P7C70_g2789, partial [Phenoliferia sp. Uapishka_3]